MKNIKLLIAIFSVVLSMSVAVSAQNIVFTSLGGDKIDVEAQKGKIVAVGKGKINEEGNVRPLDLQAGDTVLFGKYAGTEVKIENEDRLIMREDDVLAVIE